MVDHLGLFDGFSLHLKICGGIAVGRGDTGVAKPLTNRKDIDPRSQQMYRGAMAHAVGVKAFVRQCGSHQKCGAPDFLTNPDDRIFHRLQHFQGEAPCIHYFVFDLLISSGRDLTKLPLSERRKLLTTLSDNLQAYRRESGGTRIVCSDRLSLGSDPASDNLPGHDDLDATVLLPACGCGVVGYGIAHAQALRR